MSDVICWEALDAADKALEQVRQLYEITQAEDERVPWEWIERGVTGRASWRRGRWATHLLLAAPRSRQASIVGFALGIYLPGYAGYLSYIGVAPRQRGRGIGTQLIRVLTHLLQADAACAGTDLPFVIWESRRPAADASEADQALWAARMRLFERVGALWVAGIDFLAANYYRRGAPPIPQELFLLPVDRPAGQFDAAALRAATAGLLRALYGRKPGDEVFERVLAAERQPSLRPVSEAVVVP
jgi:GNAT superfamily N-acetyltransferase